MSNEKFSLCIPYYDFLNNRVSNLMWRIADFYGENDEFYAAEYTMEGDSDYLPRRLSVNPYKTISFKPSVYSWSRGEDLRVRSNDTGIVPIEIIKLDTSVLENHNSDLKIREILHTGIPLYEHTLENFLLVINEDDTYYEALAFRKKISSSPDKNIFKIEKTCQDMNKTTHRVDLVKINKEYIIDTSESNIRSSEYSYAPIRYFYKYLNLPRITRMFELREPQDYAKAFVSKYLKTKHEIVTITNKDRQRLGQMIDIALTDKAEIESFFDETGYSLDDIEYALLNLNSEVLSLLLENNKFSDIIEGAILRNSDLRSELVAVAEKLWVAEATEVKISLDKDINEAESILENSKSKYNTLLKDIKEANLNLAKLNLSEQEKQQKLDNLDLEIKKNQDNIKAEIQNFQDDVVHLAALSACSNNSAPSSNQHKGFVAQEGTNLEGLEFDESEDLNVFSEDLQVNMDIAGIDNSATIAISRIIISTLILNKNLIIDANCDNIADGLSVLIDSCYTHKIFITDSIVNMEALIEYINSLTNKVVLIYGLLDTYNEKVFITLSHLCKDKFIIFACEDTDTFDTLPTHWCKYATILSLRELVGVHTDEEYVSYVVNKTLFEYKKDSNHDIEDIKRVINKDTKEINLSKTQALALQEIFAICKKKFDDFRLVEEFLLKRNIQTLECIEV